MAKKYGAAGTGWPKRITFVIDKNGIESIKFNSAAKQHSLCIFEQIYFARPDSMLDGTIAYESRVKMGEALAKEHPVDADVVIGVPDAAIPASIGYSRESKIDYAEGLIRNRYVGRTFIYPDQRLRELGVKTKFNVLKNVVKNKKMANKKSMALPSVSLHTIIFVAIVGVIFYPILSRLDLNNEN